MTLTIPVNRQKQTKKSQPTLLVQLQRWKPVLESDTLYDIFFQEHLSITVPRTHVALQICRAIEMNCFNKLPGC